MINVSPNELRAIGVQLASERDQQRASIQQLLVRLDTAIGQGGPRVLLERIEAAKRSALVMAQSIDELGSMLTAVADAIESADAQVSFLL